MLSDTATFERYLHPVRYIDWVVYAKKPFAGPESVLAYLSRYTHRVAIANSRLLSANKHHVTFKWKDYRIRGRERNRSLTLATSEFIRRFLIHVLPNRFHRIRHYGILSNINRSDSLPRARTLLGAVTPAPTCDDDNDTDTSVYVCPGCGEPMIIIEVFEQGHSARGPPRVSGVPQDKTALSS